MLHKPGTIIHLSIGGKIHILRCEENSYFLCVRHTGKILKIENEGYLILTYLAKGWTYDLLIKLCENEIQQQNLIGFFELIKNHNIL